MKFEFVVVTFAHEFASLLLQVRSLARSNATDFVSKYTIIWNDVHDESYFDKKYRPRLEREFGQSGLVYEVLFRRDIFDESLVELAKGSRIQQVLKLLAARWVNSDYYCVLDTKNHVIRPLQINDFFNLEGKPVSHPQSYSPDSMFGIALSTSLEYFSTSTSPTTAASDNGIHLPTTTPYVLSKRLVNLLTTEVETKEKSTFSQAFLSGKLSESTEFILYNAYIVRRFGNVSEVYDLQERRYVTFFNTSPSSPAAVERELERMKDPTVKFLGLHRGRKLGISPIERSSFIDAWMEAGLFDNYEAAAMFMDEGQI